MYRLFITTKGKYGKRVITQNFPMTQQGLFNAEELFEQAKVRPEISELRLFRNDSQGMCEIKRWRREE